MSGESASVVEVCAVLARGSMVAARAVAGVARAPGAGVSAVGQRMEQGYARRQARRTALADWEAAAGEVVDRNSRISVLAARPGELPGLPAPLVLAEQSTEQLTAWCAETDQALAAVERTLLAEAEQAVSVTLASVRGGDADATRSADDALREHAAAGSAPPPDLVEACSRILGGLSADVPAGQRGEVLAAVSRVRDCGTAAERQSWLAELRVRVRQANTTAAQRREQARTAATMLQALAESTESTEFTESAESAEDTAAATLRDALRAVVAGRRELDPGLHDEALAACERVRAERESGYVQDALTRGLEKLGYQVEQGFDTFTGQGARLRLVRAEWPEHAVSVVVDSSEVRAMVVRTESADGDDAVRLDLEREQQWCADFDELRDQVAGDGLRLDVQRLVPPGERHVPVAARRPRPAGRKRSRERDR